MNLKNGFSSIFAENAFKIKMPDKINLPDNQKRKMIYIFIENYGVTISLVRLIYSPLVIVMRCIPAASGGVKIDG